MLSDISQRKTNTLLVSLMCGNEKGWTDRDRGGWEMGKTERYWSNCANFQLENENSSHLMHSIGITVNITVLYTSKSPKSKT